MKLHRLIPLLPLLTGACLGPLEAGTAAPAFALSDTLGGTTSLSSSSPRSTVASRSSATTGQGMILAS